MSDDCGRWRNGRLIDECLNAGTDYCRIDCPYNGPAPAVVFSESAAPHIAAALETIDRHLVGAPAVARRAWSLIRATLIARGERLSRLSLN